MLAEIAFACKLPNGRDWRKQAVLTAIKWGTPLTMTFLIITLVWARGSVLTTLRSHFGDQSMLGSSSPHDFPFKFALLENHVECVLAAIAGVILVIRWRQWREMAFPLVFLAHRFRNPCSPSSVVGLLLPALCHSAGLAVRLGHR